MDGIRKITGLLLIAIYAMVILHNVVPHLHLNSNITHSSHIGEAHHQHHSHEHSHHHEQNENLDIFHSLSHLFGNGLHSHQTPEHLVHVTSKHKTTWSQLKVYYAIVFSIVFPQIDSLEKKEIPSFVPPSYEKSLYTATPLRAPPSLV